MHILEAGKKATLLLADGTVFEGRAMGAEGKTVGEVVFTTGMTAYQETLTDPSYYGQIVTQTFPLVGNYGVNGVDRESDGCYVKGYIVREWCEHPSNFRSEHDLDWFLKQNNVVGIYDIDTRALTRKLREHGVMNGMICTGEIADQDAALQEIRAYRIENAVAAVSVQEPQKHTCEQPQFKVALLDFGYKHNILRSLLARNCNVTIMPALTTAQQIKEGGFDGVMLSNGPGDPAENVQTIANLREICQMGLPVFGICLGHQLTALAHGAKTEKLKYGHRGANQPVIDLCTGLTYVTSQNHGYAVLGDTIPKEAGVVSHINANDQSCEGAVYGDGHIFTVQFHPEACGGPTDTSFLFDRFVELMKKQKGVG